VGQVFRIIVDDLAGKTGPYSSHSITLTHQFIWFEWWVKSITEISYSIIGDQHYIYLYGDYADPPYKNWRDAR